MDEETVHTELVNLLNRLQIDEIRDNNPNVTKLVFVRSDNRLSDAGWRLLGRYIANNTHLQRLMFSSLTDAKVIQLFQELTKSSSITVLSSFDPCAINLGNIGMAGVQTMIPFLQKSPKLIKIDLSKNNIDSQGFESLVNTLDEGKIEDLFLNECRITDISALGNVTLPCIKKLSLCNNNSLGLGYNIGDISSYTSLEDLNLRGNGIGIDGCRAIANLLQKEGSSLKTLSLAQNGIDDEGAEVLANSLEHNKKLDSLYLNGNNLQAKGYRAILKLLLDISSIENTCNNSNHTITTLGLNPPNSSDKQIIKKMNTLKKCIHKNTTLNKHRHPGRAKVILTHLNSKNKKGLCELQGIEYSYESIFSEIDALVLPEVLSFVSQAQYRVKNTHLRTQTELFRMLVTVAPDLSSIVNRPAFFRERIENNEAKVVALGIEHEQKIAAMNAKHEREVAALIAEKLEMKRELEALQSGEKTNDKEVKKDEKLSGKKRNRS